MSISPVALAEAKAHLRVTHEEDDAIITQYNDAAASFVETLADRVFTDRSITAMCATFPPMTGPIALSYSPVQTIDQILYYDPDGVQQTLDLADVSLVPNEVGLSWIVLQPDATWPTTQVRPDAITITYTAGYGGDVNVPPEAKQAILLCLTHYYDQRTTVVVGTSAQQLEFTVTNLTESLSPGTYIDT